MSEPLSENPLENETVAVPPKQEPQRSLLARLLISLLLTAVITGIVFWSGYSILRSPAGWVGDQRFVNYRLDGIRHNLAKYHDKHGEYPETLREVYVGEDEYWDDNLITVYRHPVIYERTESGWVLTVYGMDGKPGGVGLDADTVVTDKTDFNELSREFFHNKKYDATFEQVRTYDDGSYFRNLVGTSCVFGFLVFLLTFGIVNSQKKSHIGLTITTMIMIAVPAVIVGIAIMGVHNIASGH